MDRNEIVTFEMNGRPYVYIDEEQVASLAELIDFANAHRKLFHQHRQDWPSVLLQTAH
jgi:hypothetical protein